jgi:hypothetical protein
VKMYGFALLALAASLPVASSEPPRLVAPKVSDVTPKRDPSLRGRKRRGPVRQSVGFLSSTVYRAKYAPADDDVAGLERVARAAAKQKAKSEKRRKAARGGAGGA